MNTVATLAWQLIFARLQTRGDRSAVMQVCRRWRDCGRRYAFPPLAYAVAEREHAHDTMCELWTHSREWLARTHEAEQLCLEAAVRHAMVPHDACLACNHATDLVHMIMRNSTRRESLLEYAISLNASCVRIMLPYVVVTPTRALDWLILASETHNAEALNTLMADTRVLDPCDSLNRLVYCAALHGQGHLVATLLGQRRYDAQGLRKVLEAMCVITELYDQYPWNIETHELALLWAATHNAVDVATRALTCTPMRRSIVEKAIGVARNAGYAQLCQLLEEAAVTERNADSTA